MDYIENFIHEVKINFKFLIFFYPILHLLLPGIELNNIYMIIFFEFTNFA